MGNSEEIGTSETGSTGGLERASTVDPSDLQPGTMVGEYKIEGLLGEGGMGRVYSATHPVIAKRAAIKILHPELSVNREAVERFIQEARSVNQIGHPNIVDIFAFGTLTDGRSYFVMEWMRGKSLRDRLRESGLTMPDTLSIIETISIALEAAHEKGIVHRDLKPDNIFLVDVKGTLPTVKLLDFGIAKLLGNDSDRIEKTRTGNLLGTPAYISPEQARGQHVDHRTDIYALGALMYEMLTGALVFPAESAADMIAKHLYENPPDARGVNPHVPPPLANLIIAMLAKDVNRRPTLEQVRSVIGPLRAMQLQGAPAGGYPPMYTPQPPMQTPHTAQQYLTPPPNAYQTGPVAPAAAMQSHVGTGTNIGLVTEMPVRKSRLPIVIAVLLLLGGAGGAAIVALSTGGADKRDNPTTAPAVNLDPQTKPEATPETPTATETETGTKPATAPTPPETTATDTATEPDATPTKPEATEPDTTTSTKPETTKPETTKPEITSGSKTGTKSGSKSGSKKKGNKKKVVEDPDAPM